MFTFIVEFKGGTYISQIESINLQNAVLLWGKKLSTYRIKYLGVAGEMEILSRIKGLKPTAIEGLSNVWFMSIQIRTGIMFVNVIKTMLD